MYIANWAAGEAGSWSILREVLSHPFWTEYLDIWIFVSFVDRETSRGRCLDEMPVVRELPGKSRETQRELKWLSAPTDQVAQKLTDLGKARLHGNSVNVFRRSKRGKWNYRVDGDGACFQTILLGDDNWMVTEKQCLQQLKIKTFLNPSSIGNDSARRQ